MRRTTLLIASLLIFLGTAMAQVSVAPLPVAKYQFFDAAGKPLAFGWVCTFAAGGVIPQATYTDYTGTVANATCPTVATPASGIHLDSGGFANIWLGPLTYNIYVLTSARTVVWNVDGVKSPTGSLTMANLTITGNLTVTGTAALGCVPRLNNIRYSNCFAGGTMGARIVAAIGDGPATGVVVDSRGEQGPQTIAQNVFAGTTKPVRLLLGAASVASPYTITVGQVITVPGTSIEGLGRHATTLVYTPNAGTAITVTVPLGGSYRAHPKLAGFSLYGPGKAVGAASGTVITDGRGFKLSDLYISAFSVDGLVVTGDAGLGTNTNTGSADGVLVQNVGTNGIRIEGDNANVLHFINMDVSSCAVGVYFKGAAAYPTGNFFHGHVSYNTTNLLVESRQNYFKVWLENDVLTTWHIYLTATSGYNTIEVLNTSDTLKYRDLGKLNSIRRDYALWQTFPTDPTASSQAGGFQTYPSAIAGANALDVEGVQGIVTVRANNTQNWTSGYGLSGVWGEVNITAAAAGTVTNTALFRGYSNIQAGTITNWYGSYIPAPTVGGTGAITNKWSYRGAAGAGIAQVADGIKIADLGATITKHVSATASLDFTALAANTCETLTIAVVGAADGNTVTLGVPNALADVDGATERTDFFGWVSAADVVSVRRCNPTLAATADPAAATVRADVWQH